MNKLKCPIFNSYNSCAAHPDCIFLRKDNCAILLSASLAEENAKEVQRLCKKMDAMDTTFRQLMAGTLPPKPAESKAPKKTTRKAK